MISPDASSQEVWLEILRCPRETWVSDIETVMAAIRKKEEKEKQDEAMSEVVGSSVVFQLHTTCPNV